ncbi:MAG: leucine-rich repeat domain-containing protein, partial [Bacteroidetes bacterium]|nr:leucine-rich repeat domain-containing protein [Bacteroidota bacterium]
MSELAQNLIIENKKTKSTKLDLGNCGLTELPEELFELFWLKELNLSELYEEMDDDDDLIFMNGSQNPGGINSFSKIPNKIKKLVNLEKLIIGQVFSNLDKPLDIKHLAKLTNLKFLDITKNNIRDITPLSNLAKLEVLYLNDNPIEDISPLK